MNDWLSEIEEDWDGIHVRYRMKRMARVIRELTSYMRANNALEGANSGIEPSDIPRLRKIRQIAWDNLSPDAKELLK